MNSLSTHLIQYALYHRDQRNIFTHIVGVPMIVIAIMIVLSKPSIIVAGMALSPAVVVSLLAMVFYLQLDIRFGLVMSALFLLGLGGAASVALLPGSVWLGIGLFVLGWIIQFIGHYFEGKKPAFLDDIKGLLIGPLFIVAEIGFRMGLRLELQQHIERHAGEMATPT